MPDADAVAFCVSTDVTTVRVLSLVFAVTTSGMPSRFQSPTASDCAPEPTVALIPAAKVLSPLPRRTVMLELKLATIRSAFPSAFRSAIAMAESSPPLREGLAAAVKVPSPLPRRMVTVPLYSLLIARSSLPSPFRSPTAIELE